MKPEKSHSATPAAQYPALVQNAPTSTLTASYYPPLALETRTHIETAPAAHHLLRRPQTLRAWACLENGPLRPIRVNGRLGWAVADIRRLMGVAV